MKRFICSFVLIAAAGRAGAAVLPAGFAETRVASGLVNVTAMAVAPDGRVFVSEQAGRLRIVENDALVTTPALTLTVDATNERGLLGVAFDPAFATNGYLYVYYTVPNPNPDPTLPTLGAHNRVSRFTLAGNVVDPASERVLLELPNLGTAPIHNGGSLHFGPDGKLYVSVGDNYNFSTPQSLATPLGKLLRVNADGTIPADNPFVGVAGAHPAIWAYGLRNPYTFAIQPSTGRIFVNDVGDKLYDEINDVVRGGNYGWPDTEGPHDNPAFLQPFFYTPWSGQNCTTIGAAFYEPAVRNFPVELVGRYFFGDLCGNYIKVMDPATASVEIFATGLSPAPPQPGSSLVDLDVAPNGHLYYLNRNSNSAGTSSVWKIFRGQQAPTVSAHPQSQLVSSGETATFTCSGSGATPLAYRWRRNGVDVAGANGAAYAFVANTGDDGAQFACVISNEFGEVVSQAAVLTVTANRTPDATILTPVVDATYQAGQTLFFDGDAFDFEDGALPASAFTWTIALGHDDHEHPALGPVSGIKNGSYPIPTIGETSTNVRYIVTLTVVDSAGLKRSVTRIVRPQISTFTITSTPPGRTIKLDGQPRKTPLTVTGVVGVTRSLSASVQQQEEENSPVWYDFLGWSDGGSPTHTISTPATPTTYTAQYRRVEKPECVTFETLSRFVNLPLPAQTGRFSVEFDATPVATTSTFVNANIGFSEGPRGGLPGQAGMIIFNNMGRIQARGVTGGEPPNTSTDPTAPVAPPYTVNQTYHFRLEFDLTTHTYDAYYTAPGQPEALLRAGLRFRVEHAFITEINNWGVFASPVASDPTATVRVCRLSVNCAGGKNTPPIVTAPPNVSVQTGSGATACSRVVSDTQLGTAGVTDNCPFGLSGVSRSGVPAGNVFPVGTTTVTYTATDGAGAIGTALQRVVVADDTRPVLGTLTASPGRLWPPDRRMVTVKLAYTSSDNCGALQKVVSVRSDQPQGNERDWIVVDGHTVKLRAERTHGRTRTYTITVDLVDAAGNVTSRSVKVKVQKP